jgi:hypothetical protein
MAQVMSQVRVLFPADFDEQSEFETPSRGYLSEVIAELDDGTRFQLFFIDPVRLQQELKMDADNGQPYFAEPNLIVLPRVTVAAIHDAVSGLLQQGYFQHLKPLA